MTQLTERTTRRACSGTRSKREGTVGQSTDINTRGKIGHSPIADVPIATRSHRGLDTYDSGKSDDCILKAEAGHSLVFRECLDLTVRETTSESFALDVSNDLTKIKKETINSICFREQVGIYQKIYDCSSKR